MYFSNIGGQINLLLLLLIHGNMEGEVVGGAGDDHLANLGYYILGPHLGPHLGNTLGDHTWGTHLRTTLGDHIWGPYLGTIWGTTFGDHT